MKKLRDRESGFTIVELLIVLVVIGILTLLVVSTYSGIQAKSRNTTRQHRLENLQSQIEAFYSQNGYYPNLTDLNSPSWRTTNMKNLNQVNLVDPSSNCDPSKQSCLGGSPSGIPKQFQYYATQSDGVTSCNGKLNGGADQNCAQYTLTATYEGTVNGSKYDVLKNLD
ncbi:MAG TPA: type II secretion system protein [Candidatus Sulfotelmatobacter sp.]|nr:type II secretion system protein [Candidatus Sulfotelmatobacter sp.]